MWYKQMKAGYRMSPGSDNTKYNALVIPVQTLELSSFLLPIQIG